MSRRQKAIEERYRSQPKGKEKFPAKTELEKYQMIKQCSEAERMKAEWIEQNRECTVEDVLKKVADDCNFSAGVWAASGMWSMSYVEPKWKTACNEIVNEAKNIAMIKFGGNRFKPSQYPWNQEYTEEFISFFKRKAVEEFHKRNTPLYKML